MKDCTNCIHYKACLHWVPLSTMERFCAECPDFESKFVIEFKPDGEHKLDPCQYVLCEEHKNVDVEVSQCADCGKVDISWLRRQDTKSTYYRRIEGEAVIMTRKEEEDVI